MDCEIWIQFLKEAAENPRCLCRPFLDINAFETSVNLQFFTDVSGSLGLGAFFQGCWFTKMREKEFLCEPSIAYLELYTLTAAILTWQEDLQNIRIIIHCDNQSVVNMVNNTSSNCTRCLDLIYRLLLNGMVRNR